MAKPKFNLEKRRNSNGDIITENVPIYLYFSFNGERLPYYTGIRVDAKYFVKDYHKLKKKPIKPIAPYAEWNNNFLQNMETNLLSIYNRAIANGVALSKDYFRSELDKIYKQKVNDKKEAEISFTSYFRKVMDERKSGVRLMVKGKRVGQPFTEGTVKVVSSTLSAVHRYMDYKGIKALRFEDVDDKFYTDFRAFILQVEEKELITFSGFIKDIKTIMNEAKEDKLHSSSSHESKRFAKPNVETDTVALTLEQCDRLHSLKLSNKDLDETRDRLLIGCYSALRFSDFSNLKIEQVEENFIRVVQKKTGERVTVPIISRLRSILDKYQGGFPPPVTNQEFNRTIKEVCKMPELGMDHYISVKNYKKGVENIEQVKFYDMISSHTGRRTYATIMFKAGVPSMLIMAVTGHKTEASFLKYIRATNEDKARMMSEMMKKLGF